MEWLEAGLRVVTGSMLLVKLLAAVETSFRVLWVTHGVTFLHRDLGVSFVSYVLCSAPVSSTGGGERER